MLKSTPKKSNLFCESSKKSEKLLGDSLDWAEIVLNICTFIYYVYIWYHYIIFFYLPKMMGLQKAKKLTVILSKVILSEVQTHFWLKCPSWILNCLQNELKCWQNELVETLFCFTCNCLAKIDLPELEPYLYRISSGILCQPPISSSREFSWFFHQSTNFLSSRMNWSK